MSSFLSNRQLMWYQVHWGSSEFKLDKDHENYKWRSQGIFWQWWVELPGPREWCKSVNVSESSWVLPLCGGKYLQIVSVLLQLAKRNKSPLASVTLKPKYSVIHATASAELNSQTYLSGIEDECSWDGVQLPWYCDVFSSHSYLLDTEIAIINHRELKYYLVLCINMR